MAVITGAAPATRVSRPTRRRASAAFARDPEAEAVARCSQLVRRPASAACADAGAARAARRVLRRLSPTGGRRPGARPRRRRRPSDGWSAATPPSRSGWAARARRRPARARRRCGHAPGRAHRRARRASCRRSGRRGRRAGTGVRGDARLVGRDRPGTRALGVDHGWESWPGCPAPRWPPVSVDGAPRPRLARGVTTRRRWTSWRRAVLGGGAGARLGDFSRRARSPHRTETGGQRGAGQPGQLSQRGHAPAARVPGRSRPTKSSVATDTGASASASPPGTTT